MKIQCPQFDKCKDMTYRRDESVCNKYGLMCYRVATTADLISALKEMRPCEKCEHLRTHSHEICNGCLWHGKAITDDMALAMAHEETHGKATESPVITKDGPVHKNLKPCPYLENPEECNEQDCPKNATQDCYIPESTTPPPAHGAKREYVKDGLKITEYNHGEVKG